MRVTPLVHGGDELVVLTYPIRRPAVFACLTAGELDAVEGVLEGRTHREIAAEKGVSPRTIANQLASAYRKLGVRGAGELGVLVQRARGTASGR